MYAQDYDGLIAGYQIWNSVETAWLDPLFSVGKKRYINNFRAFFCPSYPPLNPTMYDTITAYGMRHLDQNPNPNNAVKDPYRISILFPNAGNGSMWYRLYKIRQPQDYILVMDSRYPSLNKQCYAPRETDYRLHLRHNQLANILFADGHVEACGPTRIRQAYTAEIPTFIMPIKVSITVGNTVRHVDIN